MGTKAKSEENLKVRRGILIYRDDSKFEMSISPFFRFFCLLLTRVLLCRVSFCNAPFTCMLRQLSLKLRT